MRRLLWSLGDQALSSAVNVALTVVVAREAGPRELGAFGAAYALYLILLGLSRASASEPLLVRFSHVEPAEWRAGSRASLGFTLCASVVQGAVLTAVAAALGGTLGATLLPLGLLLPALMLKDAWRYVFLAAGRPGRALLNDGVWAVAQALAIGWVAATGHPAPAGRFVAAWGLSAGVAALFGCAQARWLPDPRRWLGWLSAHRDLLPGYTIDFAARMGGRQITMLAVGLVGGLTALGAIRAAEVPLGPLNVLLQGVPLVLIPRAVAAVRRSPGALRSTVVALTAGLAALAAAYGLLLLVIPDAAGRAFAGVSWAAAKPVLPAQCLLFAGMAAMVGPSVGLRALGDARRGATVRLAIVPMSLGFGAAGVLLAGAPGAIYGLALASWSGLALWYRQFLRALDAAPSTLPRVKEAALP